VDLCGGETGCVYEPSDEGCDDGNACTVGDSCVEGACKGLAPALCDDENGCTHDACDPIEGCVFTNHGGPCDDGSVCTVGDVCADGGCSAGAQQLVCDDGNPCTEDSCDGAGGCVFAPVDGACSDGSDCTVDDACVAGACVGAGALSCDDSNPCTEDSCLPDGGCDHEAIEGPCFDGDLCTLGDACAAGACVGGAPQDCDDGNPCTDDSCGEDGSCDFIPADGACDDGNPCTIGDHCAGGTCAVTGPLACDDENVCTTDFCDPLQGCQFVANDAPCSDGDVCSPKDVCFDGWCVGTGILNCEDGNPCTDDGCDADVGCVFDDNEAPCDDADVCTTVDACVGGQCVGADLQGCADADPCTDDGCHPVMGCVYQYNTSICDDDDQCTQVDACEAGECVGTLPLVCEDGNLCTDDGCAADEGCLYLANSAPCNDGNACTVGDQCGSESCQPGLAALPCDDGEFCNGVETCDSLDGCLGGAPPNLDDGVECTVDGCDEAADQVTHQAVDSTCSDGSFCNGDETCDPGEGCVSGAPPEVDDGVACTQDSCSDAEGGSILHLTDNSACPDAGLCASAVCHPTEGCQVEVTENCCGNQIVEAGEACDDGNDQSQDGCLSNCQVAGSCKSILDAGLADGDGVYELDPDGVGGDAPISAWCDMADGGWTLVVAWESGFPSQPFGELPGPVAPSPSNQHAIPFKKLSMPSEYRVRYSGNGEQFSGAISGGWETSGKSTRVKLSDNRYLIFDGQYCGSNAGLCVVHPNHADNFNCDGNGGQLTNNGQGLYSQCTYDEWCGCSDRGWKINGGTCSPSVCPISANVLVFLR
jgi:cysteine-rich repeat protein